MELGSCQLSGAQNFKGAPTFLENLWTSDIHPLENGTQVFPKIYKPSQNSRHQKGDKNEVPYEDPQISGATVQTFSRYDDLAPRICVLLHYRLSFTGREHKRYSLRAFVLCCGNYCNSLH
jgi:hypothetical protein